MTQRQFLGRLILAGAPAVVALALAVSACGPGGSPGTSSTPASVPPPASPTHTATPVDTATPATSAVASTTASTVAEAQVTFTVLYDDRAMQAGAQADHGFSCLVQGLERTVLFDTGRNGEILISNMAVLGIAPGDVDVVVLSHAHTDHTGGLGRFLESNPDVTVYYPASFSERLAGSMRAAGASLAPVDGPVSPCAGLFVTGPTGDPGESGLLVDTSRGRVLVTGCAHPGIVDMTRAASDLVGEPVYAVMGGFHLMSHSAAQVDRIILALRELGVERCGPAHCTGETATARMKEAFGAGIIEMGVGSFVAF